MLYIYFCNLMPPKKDHIKNLVRGIPDKPGVYQYFNKEGTIIYVGKAKSLKKRVASYFNKNNDHNGKTKILVNRIADIKIIIVETELDALLLENNLIKKYQPRYNVMLKDDKTYPWICIKDEDFPRIFTTRKFIRDGSQYFGPYANGKMMHTLLELIHHLYKLRTCNLKLNQENIEAKKFKICLEYHIHNCLGPCEAFQTKVDYDQTIAQIKEILKGNIHSVIAHLEKMMKDFAERFEFEKAHVVKEKIELLERYKSKSIIVNPNIHNVDVYSLVSENDFTFVNFFKVVNGAIIQAHTLELKKKLDETPEELLALAIIELRERFHSDSKEIIVPFKMSMDLPDVHFTVPKIGDKKHLLALSEKNVRYYMKEKIDQYEKLDPQLKTDKLLALMQKDLRLSEPPKHIECFDNSNIQGDYPVAAMTVFKDAKPSKKDYRHFNIKTVTGPNDFASMEEIIFRRYKRMLDEKQEMPQLIVIDGGKGQLSAAIKSLKKLKLMGKIGIIGIAKRLEEIFYPGDKIPMYLDKKSETLRIIQQLRDEAHRFGITHHRNQRSKGTIKTELTQIAGIGTTISDKLLAHFKSVKKIKLATLEELEEIIGKAKAKLVSDYFNQDKDK